jgi:hypothetical protein
MGRGGHDKDADECSFHVVVSWIFGKLIATPAFRAPRVMNPLTVPARAHGLEMASFVPSVKTLTTLFFPPQPVLGRRPFCSSVPRQAASGWDIVQK